MKDDIISKKNKIDLKKLSIIIASAIEIMIIYSFLRIWALLWAPQEL